MAELNHPTYKLCIIHKLQLPLDIIREIYKCLFYDITKLNFYKQKSNNKININKMIISAYSRTNIPFWLSHNGETWETQNNWMFGFVGQPVHDESRIQLQGENCSKCGEYSYLSYSAYPHIHSNVKLCNCS